MFIVTVNGHNWIDSNHESSLLRIAQTHWTYAFVLWLGSHTQIGPTLATKAKRRRRGISPSLSLSLSLAQQQLFCWTGGVGGSGGGGLHRGLAAAAVPQAWSERARALTLRRQRRPLLSRFHSILGLRVRSDGRVLTGYKSKLTKTGNFVPKLMSGCKAISLVRPIYLRRYCWP